MARWLLPAVCGLALIGAWKMSRAQPACVAPPRVDIPVATNEPSQVSDEDAEFVPGLEDHLAKEAEAARRADEAAAPVIALEAKPVETSKLHKEAKFGGALDLVAAHERVAPLYSTKPYVSILPPSTDAYEGPRDRESFVPTRVFEKDEAYGPFERQGRDRIENTTENDPGYNRFFGSVNFGIVIPH